MKIPFDIKYRPQIESGEYKVEVAEGCSVRIVYWDAKRKNGGCICGFMGEEEDEPYFWQPNGSWWADGTQSPLDLLIVTPEEEKLTPFEVEVKSWMGVAEDIVIDDSWVKTCAKALLSLARKQFVKDGYVIEKKIFHDAVKRVDPGIMKEVSKNVDMTEYEKGRADALKDLPRWKKICRGNNYSSETKFTINGRYLEMNDTLNAVYEVALSDLEKLPRFKED